MTLLRVASSMPRPLAVLANNRTAPFWEGLAQGQFLLARCNACEKLNFPPRNICPHCHGDRFIWEAAQGDGVLYAGTRVHAAGAGFACMTPYSVGLVDLTEGVRVLTRLLTSASSLEPGAAIKMVVIDHTDGPLFAAVAAQSEYTP